MFDVACKGNDKSLAKPSTFLVKLPAFVSSGGSAAMQNWQGANHQLCQAVHPADVPQLCL